MNICAIGERHHLTTHKSLDTDPRRVCILYIPHYRAIRHPTQYNARKMCRKSLGIHAYKWQNIWMFEVLPFKSLTMQCLLATKTTLASTED